MQKSLLFLLFFVIVSGVNAQDKPLPAELKPFVKSGHEVLDFSKADLNGDAKSDYVLILKAAGEDTLTFDNPEWDASRILLLITRQANGKLKTTVTNDELVMCRNCGGAMGDPYQGLTTKPGELTVDFFGGSSWKWGETITFKYDKLKKDWFLQKHVIVNSRPADPEYITTQAVISRSEAGDITLREYDPNYNADTSAWKVNAVKTYFYESPTLNAKPTKAYVLKGDELAGYKRFKNFIECSFTNDKGTITSGYILRKDLAVDPNGKVKAGQ